MVLTTKALADWFPRERRATVMGAKFMAQSGAGSVAGLVLPSLALSIETEELGISGGLQDRAIQFFYESPIAVNCRLERTFEPHSSIRAVSPSG